RPWFRACFLDYFLSCMFLKLWRQSRPDFSSLFLNVAAHIQHHYMFSSQVYKGSQKNPEWYVKKGADPLLDTYKLYDDILASFAERDDCRIAIATGLHQDPHPTPIFYYRLKDYGQFLRDVGISFRSVLPRMSRDFLIEFDSEADCQKAA